MLSRLASVELSQVLNLSRAPIYNIYSYVITSIIMYVSIGEYSHKSRTIFPSPQRPGFHIFFPTNQKTTIKKQGYSKQVLLYLLWYHTFLSLFAPTPALTPALICINFQRNIRNPLDIESLHSPVEMQDLVFFQNKMRPR